MDFYLFFLLSNPDFIFERQFIYFVFSFLFFIQTSFFQTVYFLLNFSFFFLTQTSFSRDSLFIFYFIIHDGNILDFFSLFQTLILRVFISFLSTRPIHVGKGLFFSFFSSPELISESNFFSFIYPCLESIFGMGFFFSFFSRFHFQESVFPSLILSMP